MELHFKIQKNEQAQLEKLFNRIAKRHNRQHIVEDMIAVRKAKKAAIAEKRMYKNYQKVPTKRSKFTRWYHDSKIKGKISKLLHKIKSKIFSYESVYMYIWHTILDGWDHIRRKKAIYLPLSLLLVVSITGTIAYNIFFGYEITFNGHSIGIVDNLNDFNAAMENVDANLTEWYANDNLYYEQSITIKNIFIKDRSSVMDQEACEEAIYACDFPLFVDGGVVAIDGIETVRLASKEDAQKAVDQLLEIYIGEDTDTESVVESQIVQNITVESKIVQMGTEKTVDEAVKYMESLSTTASGSDKETETPNEAIKEITHTTNDNQGLITALAFRASDFSVGETSVKPALTIKTVKEVVYEAPIAYGTSYQDDPNQFIGAQSEVSAGIEGTKEVTALITYTNGNESEREILSETVVTEPVNEIIARGTKTLPPAESTGSFLIPTSGRISTIFGTSSHAGGCAVDIATPTGTPVYASDSGVIALASYYGTYGNTIKLNHGDGYSTLYAHLSQFNVTVGQQVSQGQVIGYVGNTGYSTGSHLHFEIRYNNDRQPILNYFSYFAVGQRVNALQ